MFMDNTNTSMALKKGRAMILPHRFVSLAILVAAAITFPYVAFGDESDSTLTKTHAQDIKAYCLDFNWAGRRGFAKPGTWKNADPVEHVNWYKTIGANVIQTFAVSCNGYAWYKDGVVPEQPGLKHDFLREVVKLGHAEGMKVMGYFCIAANTRWGEENPELSYGTPSTYHIPYTDEYLQYLSAAIADAVKTTGIDGFMIDWVWMPRRRSTNGKWIEAEKKLYQQLMGEPFPGEDQLTRQQDLTYSRKAIDRCWKTIRKAAKQANPDCIIWLTTNKVHHPHVVNSDMYKQVDWLMGESGRLSEIQKIRPMVGDDTRLITCMSDFGGPDATTVVPAAIEAGIGLYGYAKPRGSGGTINLSRILPKQLSELSGNNQRIAVLARAYRGKSIDSIWEDGKFVEPENPPAFRIKFRGRRGFSDTARLSFEKGHAVMTVKTPYHSGRAKLTRVADHWPERMTVVLKRKNPDAQGPSRFRIANGQIGVGVIFDGETKVVAGKMQGELELNRPWNAKNFLNGGDPATPVNIGAVQAKMTDEIVEIQVPPDMIKSNPDVICFEWDKGGNVR